MPKLITASAAALILSIASLSAPSAFAKGGQDNYERQQELRAEFAKSRDVKEAQPASGLFNLLFGSDDQEATKASKAKSEPKAAK